MLVIEVLTTKIIAEFDGLNCIMGLPTYSGVVRQKIGKEGDHNLNEIRTFSPNSNFWSEFSLQ